MEKNWLKSYPAGVPSEINPDQYTSLVEMFEETVGKYGDKTAFINLMTPMSYRELDKKSRDFAAYLQNGLGLKQGDRVALMMPNLLQYPVAVFGILRAGLIVVNVNPLYTARELQHQLTDSGAQVILICANFAATLQEALPKTPVKHIIITELADLCPQPKRFLFNMLIKHVKKMVPAFYLPGAKKLNSVLAIGAGLPLNKPKINNTDLAFLQYTGGTTGLSKGAMLTHRNVVANILQVKALAGAAMTDKEVLVTALPLYHVFALVASVMFFMVGGTNILITNPRDPEMFIKVIKDAGFTAMIGVNTLFNSLLNSPSFKQVNLSHLRFTLSGGMATQPSVADRWHKETGCLILEGYGLTETSPVVSLNPPETQAFTGTVGLPVPSLEVSIRDENGKEMGLNEPGEICVRGPNIMKGYWQRPDESKKVLTDDGWLMTGDVGQIEDDGRLRIVDRKKDMILVSGFNVYPNEVENIIAAHPGVLEVAVIGVPADATGEAVKAYVVKKDAGLTEKDIIDHCRKQLTAYKVPRMVEFRTDLPKTNVGKILRKELRAELEKPKAADKQATATTA
ncbi:MAG: long-chain-fatty-acid--CoA ligase [Neisseriaceae bacterium]|jgi:long-chain acyl-CoA synthetase|nr:MAG: long-chain-fatty-acid--CoA ligase [Neisseriaceae bacterium]